jgi:hypothetical protein
MVYIRVPCRRNLFRTCDQIRATVKDDVPPLSTSTYVHHVLARLLCATAPNHVNQPSAPSNSVFTRLGCRICTVAIELLNSNSAGLGQILPRIRRVKMDRFVTGTEAFLIPKTVEYDDVDIYESLVRRVNEVLDDTGEDDRNPNEVIGTAGEADRNPDEVACEVALKQPIGKRTHESHSPDISEQEFAPLNRTHKEMLEEIGNILIKAIREVNICRVEPGSTTATSREDVKKAKCDLGASESTDESSDDGSNMYLYPSKGRLGYSEVSQLTKNHG